MNLTVERIDKIVDAIGVLTDEGILRAEDEETKWSGWLEALSWLRIILTQEGSTAVDLTRGEL